eukprot:Skav227068  [mRNA]  locus=scaffold72:1037919:1040303:+ [translate_table: standard]
MSELPALNAEVVSLGTFSCGILVGSAQITLKVGSQWMKQMVVGVNLTILNYQMMWHEGETIIEATGPDAIILMSPTHLRGPIQHAELFSGLGGWDNAGKALGYTTKVFVDQDPTVAKLLAQTQGATPMTAKQGIDMILQGHQPDVMVLCDQVENPLTWVVLGLCNIGYVASSPPCPPWSSAGNTKGLQSKEGEVFKTMLLWSGRLKLITLGVENVPGIVKHADFGELIRYAYSQGMVLVLSDIHSVNKVLPITRDRWLALFVHSSVKFSRDHVQIAKAISFDHVSFRSLSVSPSIQDANVIHTCLNRDDKVKLTVPDAALQAMMKPEYVPFWMKSMIQNNEPSEIMKARTMTPSKQLSGAMASYGSQHTIDDTLLQQKGLHAVVMQDESFEGGIRYVSPWEFAASMGYTTKVQLSSNIHEAWQQVGNGITAAHAWLLQYKCHIILQESSPFSPCGEPSDQLKMLIDGAIKLSEYQTQHNAFGWVLVPKQDEGHDMKAKGGIPPTEPFEISDDEQHVVRTTQFAKTPAFLHLCDPRNYAAEGKVYQGGIVFILHEQKHWATFVNTHSEVKVADAIALGLPHAKEVHFRGFHYGSTSVQWNQMIDTKEKMTLEFCPVFQKTTFSEESLQLALTLQTDVTWTSKTAAAYVSTQIGCNPDAIAICNADRVLKESDFLSGYETCNFKVKFKAHMPGYVSWAEPQMNLPDPGLYPVMSAFEQRRWFARHPAKKIVRTCVTQIDSTILELIQMLFPDVHASVQWNAYDVDGRNLEVNQSAARVDALQIQWNGYRPLPITEI